MKANMGGFDRLLRLIIALVIAIVGFVFKSWFGLIAIVPLVTAFVRWCPLYLPFGLSTCKTKEVS